MAAAYHHHHCQNSPPSAIPCCNCCCSYTYTTSPPPPPSPRPVTDPYLQAIAAHLLNKPYTSPNLHHHHQNLQFQTRENHRHQQNPQSIVSSLCRRIDALESTLHEISTSYDHSRYSLRDYAARIIQIHFRAFLVRRSKTLRQLKDLARVKSSLTSMKSSCYNKSRFDFAVLSHKAMDLLLKVDSIQGGDPMIRDGKRSISEELVRFLDFINGVSLKRAEFVNKPVKNISIPQNGNKSRVLRDQREIVEKLRDRIENIRGFSRVLENDEENVELEGFHHITDDEEEYEEELEENPRPAIHRNGVSMQGISIIQPKVKKTVSFADNGNVSVSSDDHGEFVDNISSDSGEIKGTINGTEEDDDEAQMENEGEGRGSSHSGKNFRIDRANEHNESLLFSAPLPVKMESRGEFIQKRKPVK